MGDKKQNKAFSLSTRAQVLAELRKETEVPLTCEKLGKKIGISRNSAWKGVHGLIEAGYPVHSSRKGYLLNENGSEDFLYPWEFGEKEGIFRYFSSTDSTMNRARELAERGVDEDMVITAEKQTAGKGRMGRNWISKSGGLFFTILEHGGRAVSDYTLVSMSAQIACAYAVSRLCGKRALLRWPNDVYVGGKKIAGVLTELSGIGDKLRWISCGIGVNINNSVHRDDSTSCAKILGKNISRREGLKNILDELAALQNKERSEIRNQWNHIAEGIGSKVIVVDADHGDKKNNRILARGIFAGIDESGFGIVKTGKEKFRFSPGSASFMFY